jgi:hypothetical protein
MALTFSDKPVLLNGEQRRSTLEEINARFPAGARSMETAPSAGSTPVWVCEASGQPFYAIHHRGRWEKLAYEVDNRTGQTTWRMIGDSLSQPSAWFPATRENLKT